MSSQYITRRLMAADETTLAEVIELPISEDESVSDAPSWYQRNSGALPKSEAGMGATHRRSALPSPSFDDSVGFVERIKGIFGR